MLKLGINSCHDALNHGGCRGGSLCPGAACAVQQSCSLQCTTQSWSPLSHPDLETAVNTQAAPDTPAPLGCVGSHKGRSTVPVPGLLVSRLGPAIRALVYTAELCFAVEENQLRFPGSIRHQNISCCVVWMLHTVHGTAQGAWG